MPYKEQTVVENHENIRCTCIIKLRMQKKKKYNEMITFVEYMFLNLLQFITESCWLIMNIFLLSY